MSYLVYIRPRKRCERQGSKAGEGEKIFQIAIGGRNN